MDKINNSGYYKQISTPFSEQFTQQDLKRWQLRRDQKAQLYNQLEEICQSQQDAQKRNHDLLRDFHRVERELSLLATKTDSFRRKRDIYKKALQHFHNLKDLSSSETFHKSCIRKEDHSYAKKFRGTSPEGYDELSGSPQLDASSLCTRHDNSNHRFIVCPHAQVLLKGCCNHSAVPVSCCIMDPLRGHFGNQTPDKLNAGSSSLEAIPQTTKSTIKGSAVYGETLAISCNPQAAANKKQSGGIITNSPSSYNMSEYIQCTCEKNTFYRKKDCISPHESNDQETSYQHNIVTKAEQLCLEKCPVKLQLAESRMCFKCHQQPSTPSSMSHSTSEQTAQLSQPAKDIPRKKGTLPVTKRNQSIHRPKNKVLIANSSKGELSQQGTFEYGLTECCDRKYKTEIKSLDASLIRKTESLDDDCDKNQILESHHDFADEGIRHVRAGCNMFDVKIESEHYENTCFHVKGSKNHVVMEPFQEKCKSYQQKEDDCDEQTQETKISGQDSSVSMETNGTPTASIQSRKLGNCVAIEDVSDRSATESDSNPPDKRIHMQTNNRYSELEGEHKVIRKEEPKQSMCSRQLNAEEKKVGVKKKSIIGVVEKENEDLSDESENKEDIFLKEQYRQTDMGPCGNMFIKQRMIKTEEMVEALEKLYVEENEKSNEISEIGTGNMMVVGKDEYNDRTPNRSESTEDELDEDMEETSGEDILSGEGEDAGFEIKDRISPTRKTSNIQQANKNEQRDPSAKEIENEENGKSADENEQHRDKIIGEETDTEEASEEEESLYAGQESEDFEASEEKDTDFLGSKDDILMSKVKWKNESNSCHRETEDSQMHDLDFKMGKEESTNPQKSDTVADNSQETLEQVDTEKRPLWLCCLSTCTLPAFCKKRKSGTSEKRFSEDCSLDVIQMGPHETAAETQLVAETPSGESSEESSQSKNEPKKQEWSDSEDDVHSFFD